MFKKIKFEGPKSKNLLSFKYYDAERIINGKPMKEWLRFSGAWWHIFESRGNDPFGDATMIRAWDKMSWKERAIKKVEVGFQLLESLGIEYYGFHDRDLVEEPDDINEYFARVNFIVDLLEEQQERTGIKLLWNTSNICSHKRYMSGSASSPDFDVFAYTAAQTKHNLDIAKRLKAQGFVFWGGREGYESLLHTNSEQEELQLARLYKMAVDYAKKIKLDLTFYIEPKAKEPMIHQYDYDVSTALGFLRKYNLQNHFKINIEQNHALLAGHTFHHELRMARINNALGSIDANQGETSVGWDTDQYAYDLYNSTLAMYEVMMMGGFKSGGLHFDAKLRRQSTEFEDHLYGLIMSMDAYAKGLIAASELINDGVFEDFIEQRYATWNSQLGKKVLAGNAKLEEVSNYGIQTNKQYTQSGHQEKLEMQLNNYILESK